MLEPRSIYDKAIVGLVYRCGQQPMVVYGHQQLVSALRGAGWAEEHALEHIDINVMGSWVGEGTPGVLVMMAPEDVMTELEGW